MGQANAIEFSPDGRYLAIALWKEILLWSAQKHEIVRTFKGHEDTVTSLAFTPDSKLLALGSWDGSIVLWDTSR